MTKPTIFISYSHKDEEWKDRLVTHLGVLQHEEILDTWDDRRIGGSDDWYQKIEQAINTASVAILMVSANFLTSNFILKEEIPKLFERRKKEGLRIFPVIVESCAWQKVSWLSKIQARPKDGRPLSGGNEHQINADLTAITEEIADIIKPVGIVPAAGHTFLSTVKTSLAKLPSTNPDLFGRDSELIALNLAWENPAINVLSLIAWGGVGKTSLVNKWLSQMGQDNYRSAERVYGWSFYSQGAAEGKQNSADQFIAAALQWFGDPDPTKGSPWDKGQRLAELIKQQRTLLILDGLEPLQNPPPIEPGRIKDPGLCSLLRELARQNTGLVITTTRLPVDDLKDFIGSSAIGIDLDNLSPEAGAQYLVHLGVTGTQDELKQASKDFGGHALALTLLGSYLVDVYDRDIRKRDLIPRLTDEEEQGAHAKKIMEAYEKWFEGKSEQNILYILGLFDRPAEKGAIDALLAAPPIKGLTNQVQGASPENYKLVLKHLRQARLLDKQDPREPDTLDCHPLIREHFGEKLKASNSAAWREAHNRLYEYYKTSAKAVPETIEEMIPLYAAVMHGCQAGRHQTALDEVYIKRIMRTGEHFSWHNLGLFGIDLAALASFFDPPWHKPIDGLTEIAKGLVLNNTGVALLALGRLEEAAQPLKSGLHGAIAQKSWGNAARAAGSLSSLYLTIGNVNQALEYAKQSIELADLSGQWMERRISLTTLANALHQAGHIAEAEASFHEAEEIQKKNDHVFHLLYSVQGYQYCDLLLSQENYREVQRRASLILKWSTTAKGVSLLDTALIHLSLGRSRLMRAQKIRATMEKVKSDRAYSQAAISLDHAVNGLRQAGWQDELPPGLLTRAELRRSTSQLDKAKQDLDEAFSIATRGEMRLHQTDCHLEYTRWYLAKGEKDEAQKQFAIAKKMVDEIGYHRRDKEIKELEEQFK